MHSKLVKMAPAFDKSLKMGTRVAFKKLTKKGKLIVEGTGTIDQTNGTTSIWIDNDAYADSTFGGRHDSVFITAEDVMYGRASLRIL